MMNYANHNRIRFSVIIPNWNGRHHLQECLDSLSRQTCRDFEVLLVDNGSTDGSVDFVRTAFPDTRLVELARNRGFAAGVNRGIEAACGEYVVLLNNDTEVEPRWLESLDAAIVENPDVWMFASKLLNYYDRNSIDSAGDALDLALGPYKIGEHEPSGNYREKSFIFGACGGGGCFRRELFNRIGLFDEQFFAYFEDIDLSFRANWAGFRCLFVPEAVIFHKVGGTSDTNQENKDRFDIMRRRNFIFMLIKNYPALFLLQNLPFILISHCLQGVLNIVRGRFRVAFKTQWEILGGFPGMLAKRRSIMTTRAITNGEMKSRCVPKYGGWCGFIKHKTSQIGMGIA